MSTDFARYLHIEFPNWTYLVAKDSDFNDEVIAESGVVIGSSKRLFLKDVRIGMTLKEAKTRVPLLQTIQRETIVERREFELLQKILNQISPYFIYSRSSVLSIPVASAARYFGGEANLISTIERALLDFTFSNSRRVARDDFIYGVAEGRFAARLAGKYGVVLEVGSAREFVASLPIADIEDEEISSLLAQLGVRSIGDFADMRSSDVASRFSRRGVVLHRLAKCAEDEMITSALVEESYVVLVSFEEEVVEIERLLFPLVGPLDELTDVLRRKGLFASLVEISLSGTRTTSKRQWTFVDGCITRDLTDRLRWQIEGLRRPSSDSISALGADRISIEVLDTAAYVGTQLDLYGSTKLADEAVSSSLAKVQGLLGEGSVTLLRRSNGRSPKELIVFENYGGGEALAKSRGAMGSKDGNKRGKASSCSHPLKPGSITSPYPAIVYDAPIKVGLTDRDGHSLKVGVRGLISAEPRFFRNSRSKFTIEKSLGPWLVEERWWSAIGLRRYARILCQLEDGSVHLMILEGGDWYLEATYD